MQSFFFCVSGQHGISSAIDAMSDIPTLDGPIAATGETNGAMTSPAITKTASKRPIRRRKFIAYLAMARGTGEAKVFHMLATINVRSPANLPKVGETPLRWMRWSRSLPARASGRILARDSGLTVVPPDTSNWGEASPSRSLCWQSDRDPYGPKRPMAGSVEGRLWLEIEHGRARARLPPKHSSRYHQDGRLLSQYLSKWLPYQLRQSELS